MKQRSVVGSYFHEICFHVCRWNITMHYSSNYQPYIISKFQIYNKYWTVRSDGGIYLYKLVFLRCARLLAGEVLASESAARGPCLTCGRRTGQYFLADSFVCALRAGFPALLVGGNTVLVSRVNDTSCVAPCLVRWSSLLYSLFHICCDKLFMSDW